MTNIRKVVWFNSALVQSGGGERLSLESMRCFQEAGVDATFVTYKFDRRATFDGRYSPNVVCLDHGNGPAAGYPLARRILWLRRTLRELGPDMVVTQGTWGQANDVYLATRGTGIPYAVHVFGSMFAFGPELERAKYSRAFKHAFDEVRASQPSYGVVVPERPPRMSFTARIKNEAHGWLKRKAVRAAAEAFVLSGSNRWETQRLYGRDAVVLKGAFPAAIFDAKPSDLRAKLAPGAAPVILTVSRLAKNKRVDLCIAAFAQIAGEHPRARLLIGGTGPEEPALRALSKSLGLTDRVDFLGHVAEDMLWQYMAACDVFIHMDLADFDIAPLESLALGGKVVWANEMEMDPEMAATGRVWSVAPDAADTARGLREALAAPAGPSRADGPSPLSKYSWENYAEQMLRAMERRTVP